MTDADFKIIDTAARAMKRQYFALTPTCIIGLDCEYNNPAIIYMDTKVRQNTCYIFTSNDLALFKESTNIESLLDMSYIKLYGRNVFFEKMNRIQYIKSGQVAEPISTGCLTDSDTFTSIINSKASVGNQFFIISRYLIMSIFKGLLPINKADRAMATIYQEEYPNIFLTEYVIDKKKFTIYIYTEYLKI